jgi:hypothetical protein
MTHLIERWFTSLIPDLSEYVRLFEIDVNVVRVSLQKTFFSFMASSYLSNKLSW